MDNDNGLPCESVPPVQIRIEYVHIPYKGLFINIIYLHFANFDFRKHMNKQQRCAAGIPNEIPGIGIPRYSIGIPTGPRYFKDRGYRGYINTYIKRTNNVQGNWYRDA